VEWDASLDEPLNTDEIGSWLLRNNL
jgi:hypothetical protein